jgi:hypothetical protein
MLEIASLAGHGKRDRSPCATRGQNSFQLLTQIGFGSPDGADGAHTTAQLEVLAIRALDLAAARARFHFIGGSNEKVTSCQMI